MATLFLLITVSTRSTHLHERIHLAMYTNPTIQSRFAASQEMVVDKLASSPDDLFTLSTTQEGSSYAVPNAAIYWEHHNIVKVLIPISVFGWILFGGICILCINGHGRAGRWVPEWYLDSEGTRWDKAAVGAWWLAVIFGWPLILPGIVVGATSKRIKACFAERKLEKKRREQSNSN